MDLLLEESKTLDLAPICWQGIRREYRKVWADFPLIAHPFGITLSKKQLNAIGQMLIAMDVIDSAVDHESSQPKRRRLCQSLLEWMSADNNWNQLPEQYDRDRLIPLRSIINREGIGTQFLASAARVFRASENKRNATSVSEFIRNLIDEGQAAAEMTIQVLGSNTNSGLDNFLQRIMRIGTIVDTLLDADDDFDKGILKLKPGRVFRWQLKLAIGRQLPALIWSFPDRALLWRYCLSYTTADVFPLDSV